MSIEIRDTITTKTMFDCSFDKKMQCDKLQLVVLENFGLATIRDLDQEDMFGECFCLSVYIRTFSPFDLRFP